MAAIIVNAVRPPLSKRPRRRHIGPTLKEYRARCDATTEEVERVTVMVPEPRMRPGPPIVVKGKDKIVKGKPVMIGGEPLLDEEGEPIIGDDEVIKGKDYETEGPDVEVMVDVERVDQEGTRSNAVSAIASLRSDWEAPLQSWRDHYVQNEGDHEALTAALESNIAAVDLEVDDALTTKEWPLHNPRNN